MTPPASENLGYTWNVEAIRVPRFIQRSFSIAALFG